jgi:hypothetical protein
MIFITSAARSQLSAMFCGTLCANRANLALIGQIVGTIYQSEMHDIEVSRAGQR